MTNADYPPPAPSILWAEMSHPQIAQAAAQPSVVIVPAGAIEQHGPHLPVNTDANCAYEVALEAARRVTAFPVLVAPPVWWGTSPHHMAFPGTISLSLDTYHGLIRDVCRSIAQHGFDRIVVLNGHGGNASPLAAIAQELSAGGLFVAVASYYNMIIAELKEIGESPLGGMSHAGEMETSLQMVLQPERVDGTRLERSLGKALTPYFEVDLRGGGTVFYPYDMQRDSRNGAIGDPTLATVEKGKIIFEVAVSKVVDFTQAYRAMPGSERSASA